MIIGDPYKFAVIFDIVNDWNLTLDDNNGSFSLCVDGKLFPKRIINAVIKTSLRDVLDTLKNIPEDEALFSVNTESAFETLYNRVFPSDYETDNDYRYLLSPYALTDEGCFLFAVKNNGRIYIMGSELEYDIDNSRHIFHSIFVSQIELTEEYVSDLICRLEKLLPNDR